MTGDKEFIETTRVFIISEGVLLILICGLVMLDCMSLAAVLMCLFLLYTRVAFYRKKIKSHYGPRGYPAWWRDFKF